MADVKKQLEYSEATQTLVGQQRRELMDTKSSWSTAKQPKL